VLVKEDVDPELAFSERIEDSVGVVGAVVVTDTRVIAPHDEVGTAVVLAKDRVQDGLARARVAHREREHREQRALRREVLVEEDLVASHARRGGDVVALRLSHERVEQEPVDRLERRLDEVLVRAVHRVARLEADDLLPPALVEGAARLDRVSVMGGEFPLDAALREGDAAGDGDVVRALVEPADTRVGELLRAVDVLAFRVAIDRERLVDDDAPDDLRTRAIVHGERDLLSRFETLRDLRRDREHDRQRERRAAREAHLVDDARVVVLAHEAAERAERAGREELEVRARALVEGDLRERRRASEKVARRVAREHAIVESAAVRRNGTGYLGGCRRGHVSGGIC
jgi:hypothetical protein